jgi:hypothetical protein
MKRYTTAISPLAITLIDHNSPAPGDRRMERLVQTTQVAPAQLAPQGEARLEARRAKLCEAADVLLRGARAAHRIGRAADAHAFANAAAQIARAYGDLPFAQDAHALAEDAWERMSEQERVEDRTPSVERARAFARDAEGEG